MTTPSSDLDQTQYSTDSIAHYEAVFGRDFVSPGGQAMATELIRELSLTPGARVLDIGCGLGGAAFTMARGFGLIVHGIDVSANMIERAQDKLESYGLADHVRFELGDCLTMTLDADYDAVFSRDVFLHIHDKTRLFEVIHRALKPGGKLLFTDYCCGLKPWSGDFTAYVDDRGYDLHTVDEYAALMEQAGFEQVTGTDMTDRFLELLKDELCRIDTLPFSAAELSEMRSGWSAKIARATSGDHRWGKFSAIR